MWSNSKAIRKFQTASKFSRAVAEGRQLADVYYDKAGRKRYKGNKRLKSSQCRAKFCILQICMHVMIFHDVVHFTP